MNIYIIGGGASGMLCSILIKRENPSTNVTILERNDKVGKKLLVTGNGRCNYTNRSVKFENFHSSNSNFPMHIIEQLDGDATIELLKSIGIFPAEEKNGKLFPLSYQASTVQDMLRLHMELNGVNVITEEKIDKVINHKGKYKIIGNKEYIADSVIIATGGMALPSTGSDGIGYRIARELGHTIIEPQPTIVQLKSSYSRIKSLSGVRVDSSASIYVDDKFCGEKFGDVLFTDYGLSGPAILDLSRTAIKALNENKRVSIGVNLVGIDKYDLSSIISKKLHIANMHQSYGLNEILLGLVNKKLHIPVSEILKSKYIISNLQDRDILENIVDVLSDFRVDIVGYKGFGDAQATIGGVNTLEVDNKTLESKVSDNIYFIGEVLDVDGDCGGYNLQWAWSSAYVVAKNIIRGFKSEINT